MLQQLVEDNGRTVSSPPKSAASRRVLAPDAETAAILRGHRSRQRDRAGPCAYVFTDTKGQPLRPSHVTHRFIAAVRAAGLPPVRLHDLRHGAATLVCSAGVDIKVVQEILGHSSSVITRDTYNNPRVLRQTGEKPQVTSSARVRSGSIWPIAHTA